MDQATLVAEEIDVGVAFLEVVARYLSVVGATWILPQDESRWTLFVVSPEMTPGDPNRTFQRLCSAAHEFHHSWIDYCNLRVVGVEDPVGKQSLATKNRYPKEKLIKFRGSYFGRMGVEHVLIYGVPSLPQMESTTQPAVAIA